ncbi:MAG: tetratricopeptide repeat protein [Bacteroidales bacterium]|jgi:tetratricopeptide (TPR) repeat protein|nr:tetratricopeptide repeat protein [Bacteroidales bacterium]
MKKVFLLLAVIIISAATFAQKGKVTSALTLIEQGSLDKAKEALDQAMTHPKSMNWFNTYFAKGKLAQAVFKSDNPTFKAYYTDPLGEAYAAYEKSMELDSKGGAKKKIITGMVYNSLALDLYSQGGQLFEAKDYAGALKSFETQIAITESDNYVGVTDTGMYYNAGLAAMNAKEHQKAIKFFEKCAEMQYQGINPYFQISQNYLEMGDTVKAESILVDLRNKYANDKDVTLNLIDLYIKAGKNEEALENLAIARTNDPDNYSLHFAEGIIYLNEDRFDEAIERLSKSVELKSDFYDSQYGLGASYINKASDMFAKANDIMDVNEYNKAIDNAMSVFSKALPYMEKANELKPDDVFALRSLRELYYRLKMTEKYDAVKAKLDTLEQQ